MEERGGEELAGVPGECSVGSSPTGRARNVRPFARRAPDRALCSRRPVRQPQLVTRTAAAAPVLRLQDGGRSHRGDPQGRRRRHRAAAGYGGGRHGQLSRSARARLRAGARPTLSRPGERGLGVAPMPLAAREARAAGMRVTWVHGARSAEELCSEAEGDEVLWATDDGSRGSAGTAVAAMPDADLVLACGPNRMLAAMASRRPDAQVAVETYMGCGTGVCLGCAVPLERGGYDRACKEGPVYRAADIDWSMLPAHLPYAISA